jgi:hypothetical protein
MEREGEGQGEQGKIIKIRKGRPRGRNTEHRHNNPIGTATQDGAWRSAWPVGFKEKELPCNQQTSWAGTTKFEEPFSEIKFRNQSKILVPLANLERIFFRGEGEALRSGSPSCMTWRCCARSGAFVDGLLLLLLLRKAGV